MSAGVRMPVSFSDLLCVQDLINAGKETVTLVPGASIFGIEFTNTRYGTSSYQSFRLQ